MQTRILFLGMQGIFAFRPLNALIENGHRPLALVTPPPPTAVTSFHRLTYPLPADPAARKENVYALAAYNHIPIVEIGRLKDPAALQWLHSMRLDLIVVACFNRLLPGEWLHTPRLGCINLHPSMLPAYRGPTPLEDQLASGETATGITLHFMDESADTGDIIYQQPLLIPAGADLDFLNRQAAEAGSALLLKVLSNPENIPRRPQA